MTAAYIEHRPKSSDTDASTSHYTIVVNGTDHGTFNTQKAAKDKACADGYRPVHVARVRHLQDRAQPAIGGLIPAEEFPSLIDGQARQQSWLA